MKIVRKLFAILGYEIKKINAQPPLPTDFEDLHKNVYHKVMKNTMTSAARVYSLIEAVKYVEKFNIEGDIVECGVWKGGSMMAVAETLKQNNNFERTLYLYDTFEGMSEPTEHDKTFYGETAADALNAGLDKEKNLIWAYSSLETVKAGMRTTGYPELKIKYVKGKVEDTIPNTLPQKIAILRLDTDWYESTLHEMIHLYPLLVKGGVLILDDYGHWEGAKKAVNEYLEKYNVHILLNRIDETGRMAIKQY
jgi:hypothetical protein